jgi:hypothetical protein
MSRPRFEASYFYAADSELEPTAGVPPWNKIGTQTPTFVDDGLELADISAVEAFAYYQVLNKADSAVVGPSRYQDDIAIEAYVRGLSTSPSWGAASNICLFIYDGLRKIALSIGSTLRLINPDTGVTLLAIGSNPWLKGHYYELRKVASARWVVLLDGQQVGELPYDFPPSTVGAPDAYPARAGFGILNPTGQGRAVFDLVECGINTALPPQWKIDRWYSAMPPTIAKKWTQIARAALRATVGLVEQGSRPLEEAYRSITAERLELERFYAEGVRLADEENPAWTELGGAQITGLVRERIRLDTDGTIDVGYRADFSVATGPDSRETVGGAQFLVRDYSPDGGGRVGPQIRVRDGARVAYATMFEDPSGAGDGSVVWALTQSFAVAANPPVLLGHYKWRVDPYQEHTVEVRILRPWQVLLLVDRQIVDRMRYVDLQADGAAASVRIGQQGTAPASASCRFDVSELLAERRLTDLHRRAVFEQNIIERLVFVSGCDRNDELDAWARHHWEMEGLRGTIIGIETEMRRLGCCEDVRMLGDQTYAGWVLEESFPETTPIFLDVDGIITDAVLEFCRSSLNFSDQDLANIAARYLLPLSAEEMQYAAARIVRTTGPSSIPVPGITRLPVTDVTPFEVGCEITVRNNANTIREGSTVQRIRTTPGLALDVDALDNAYAANSVVRRTLATT